MTQVRTEIRNSNRSIKNDNGFIIKRMGGWTSYVKVTGDGRTIWVDRLNPTELPGYYKNSVSNPWGVYVTIDGQQTQHSQPVEASANGFKTHGDAEQWANSNI